MQRHGSTHWSDELTNGLGHTETMKVRVKLSGAPLAYTLALVEGTNEPYKAFGKEVWSEERGISLALREMLFMRTSIINQCPT